MNVVPHMMMVNSAARCPADLLFPIRYHSPFLSLRIWAASTKWDEAFDQAFCSTCDVQDCNAEGCPYQKVRDAAILWWLGLEVGSNGGNNPGG